MNIDENKKNLLKKYITGELNTHEENSAEDKILKDKAYFDIFIASSETSILTAPENFTASIMQKINALNIVNSANHVRSIPGLSKKMQAFVCFASAAVIMLSTAFGVNAKIFDFISENADKLEKIGELFNIISYFNLN